MPDHLVHVDAEALNEPQDVGRRCIEGVRRRSPLRLSVEPQIDQHVAATLSPPASRRASAARLAPRPKNPWRTRDTLWRVRSPGDPAGAPTSV